jgi:hypothetical protein
LQIIIFLFFKCNYCAGNRPYLFVHHAEGQHCYDQATCSAVVR